STGADLVLDDELLAQTFRQILSDDARHGVVGPTGGERHDPVDRPRWITLRPGNAGFRRQRSSTSGPLQDCAAGGVSSGSPAGVPRGGRIPPFSKQGKIFFVVGPVWGSQPRGG